jgi:hypothetical protein
VEHKSLLFELETLLAAVTDNQDSDAKRDVDEHWVLQHLLSQDAELGAFLNDRGIY